MPQKTFQLLLDVINYWESLKVVKKKKKEQQSTKGMKYATDRKGMPDLVYTDQ